MSSCVCGGTNENCRYCQGTGQSGVQFPMQSLRIDRTIGRRHKSRGRCCPICGKTSLKLAKHLRNFHPEASRPLLPQPGIIRARQLTSENSLADSSASPLQESRTPTPLRATTRSLMKTCQLCNDQVREDRMQKHLDFRCSLRPGKPQRHKPGMQVAMVPHGIAEVFQQLRASRKPERPINGVMKHDAGRKPQQVKKAQDSTEDCSRDSVWHEHEVEVERLWDNLDATKDCGYPAREEGRYGSYPSHDGFDDESKP
jgi:hypothetical protein